MNATPAHQQHRARAARLARQLMPGAVAAGAWVSTQAAYRARDDTVLRPAVMVVAGEPPYDGVVTGDVALVVELDARLVQRWDRFGVHTVWAPSGDGVVTLTGGTRRVLAASEVLTVPGCPSITLPAAQLARPGGGAVLVDLHR